MLRKSCSLFLVIILLAGCLPSFASAYNAKPKIAVLIVVDQLRGDLLERYHDEFGVGGFRLFMDRGAWFTNCYYNYANTRTAPGHSTLGTGTYTLGHGIMANEWWDPTKRRLVTSVEDERETALGASVAGASGSPRNLQTGTFGDELKLATGGRAHVVGIALKDRAAILPVGHAADAAYWIDHMSGAWLTSTYYMKQAPPWLLTYNQARPGAKFENIEWKDGTGKVLETTAPRNDPRGNPVGFYDRVGATPYANDYTIDFAKAVIENEKLGTGSVTDILSVSFSSNDIQGHRSGPDSDQERAMLLTLDKQLAGFFKYLNTKFGATNVVIALSADHGIAPLPAFASSLRIDAANGDSVEMLAKLNAALSTKLGKQAQYVVRVDYPNAYLDEKAFADSKLTEQGAEELLGEEMVRLGMRGFVTRAALAHGDVPNSVFAEKFKNSYSTETGWYAIGISAPFMTGYPTGTDHALPYSYDSHVPLAFVGAPFKAGYYDETVEPVDLAVTISAVLGINKPASAVGRVLQEALTRDADHDGTPVRQVRGGDKKAQ
jgi:Type I phosphodiesterase / nucleotide pyrophosphatase